MLFNFYTALASGWTVVRVAIAAVECGNDSDCDTFGGMLMALTVMVGFLCIMFTFFCLIMFCDQLKMILDNTSTIDRKMARRAAK